VSIVFVKQGQAFIQVLGTGNFCQQSKVTEIHHHIFIYQIFANIILYSILILAKRVFVASTACELE